MREGSRLFFTDEPSRQTYFSALKDSFSILCQMAASKARVGIFVLTPHYVTRPWPMEELRIFLDRQADAEKPFLLVLYYGLQPEEIGNPKMLLRNHPEVAEHWAYQVLPACTCWGLFFRRGPGFLATRISIAFPLEDWGASSRLCCSFTYQ